MAEIKLNLGCGPRHLDGYIHIDLVKHPHVDWVADICNLHMFAQNTVSLIYAVHVFEHLYEQDARQALTEWLRVLKPGGVLRLSVPDFEALVDIYQQEGDLAPILGPLYGAYNRSTNPIDKHKSAYDNLSLSAMLRIAGFVNIERWDWRKELPPDYDDYSQAYIPHMQKDTGKLISLNLQASKP